MILLAAQESGQIGPVGIALIVGFIVILIICAIYDKKNKEKFNKNAFENFKDKVIDSGYGYHITNERQILFISSGMYELFNLDEIAMLVYIWDHNRRGYSYSLRDVNGKLVKGSRFNFGRKNAVKANLAGVAASEEDIKGMYEFFRKYVPSLQIKKN